MSKSQAFYDRIKDSLTAANLIVDLRNNTGGADKVSNKFFILLKQYANKGNIYLLINNGTMSQGEIFTLQLKKFTNAKSYGQTTKGTIAYGVNESGMEKLPSGRYGATMTDIRDSRNYLVYEDVGVAPDHVLDNTGNWTDRLGKRD